MSVIQDGTGQQFYAKVNSQNKLLVRSTSIDYNASRALDGAAYNINTNLISFTDGGEYAAFYMKYTGTKRFVCDDIAWGVGTLSGTISDSALLTVLKNPTAGTIIDNANTDVIGVNRAFGSSIELSSIATLYKGAQGYTFTDGEEAAVFYNNGNQRLFADLDVILNPTNSIGFLVDLNASGGGNFYVALIGHEEEEGAN